MVILVDTQLDLRSKWMERVNLYKCQCYWPKYHHIRVLSICIVIYLHWCTVKTAKFKFCNFHLEIMLGGILGILNQMRNMRTWHQWEMNKFVSRFLRGTKMQFVNKQIHFAFSLALEGRNILQKLWYYCILNDIYK